MGVNDVGVWVASGAGGVAVLLALWKKFSQDRTGVAADGEMQGYFARSRQAAEDAEERAEKLLARNEKLLEQHLHDGREIARLSADNTRLRLQREDLKAQIQSLGRRLRNLSTEEQRKALPTDFAPFKD